MSLHHGPSGHVWWSNWQQVLILTHHCFHSHAKCKSHESWRLSLRYLNYLWEAWKRSTNVLYIKLCEWCLKYSGGSCRFEIPRIWIVCWEMVHKIYRATLRKKTQVLKLKMLLFRRNSSNLELTTQNYLQMLDVTCKI